MTFKFQVVIGVFLFFYSATPGLSASSRSVNLAEGETQTVKTALGFSTILKFNSKPTAVVLGDQESFKVEYVGNSLTVKPVRRAVTTNLFVFTDYESFNFKLIPNQQNPDYELKITRKGIQVPVGQKKEPNRLIFAGLEVRQLGVENSSDELILRIDSVSVPPSRKAIIVHFSFRRQNGQSNSVPRFRLDQNQRPVAFHELRLPGKEQGVFVVRSSKISLAEPLTLHLETDTSAVAVEFRVAIDSKKEKGP